MISRYRIIIPLSLRESLLARRTSTGRVVHWVSVFRVVLSSQLADCSMISNPRIRLSLDLPARSTLCMESQVLSSDDSVPPQPLHHPVTLLRRPNNIVPYHTFSTYAKHPDDIAYYANALCRRTLPVRCIVCRDANVAVDVKGSGNSSWSWKYFHTSYGQVRTRTYDHFGSAYPTRPQRFLACGRTH